MRTAILISALIILESINETTLDDIGPIAIISLIVVFGFMDIVEFVSNQLKSK
jgi:hypothetical protein